jgi:hypothetical protein
MPERPTIPDANGVRYVVKPRSFTKSYLLIVDTISSWLSGSSHARIWSGMQCQEAGIRWSGRTRMRNDG